MNDAATTNEALAIVFIAAPSIRVTMACRAETALGFSVIARMAQAVVVLVFTALFTGVTLGIGTTNLVTLATIFDRGTLRRAVTPLFGARREVFVAYRRAAGKKEREK